ncbi:MAG: PD-(D/E)XK nuclease family protein [Burkholderiales bacterium]
MLEQLLRAVEGNATLVTSNRRLARSLRHAYDTRQRARGREAWPAADILPWNAWLSRLWDSCEGEPVLSPLQEQALWEQIVLESHDRLIQPGAAAKLAREAWHLAHAWRIPFDGGSWIGDAAVFREWSRTYCARASLDSARLADRLIARGRENASERQMFLVGFDELSPQQRELAAMLDCREASILADRRAPSVVRFGCDDERAEITTAARWTRDLITRNAEQRIGVIVAGLEKKRSAIEVIFEDVLHPASALPGQSARMRAFNISLAPPLAAAPVIAAALSVLEVMQRDPDLAATGRVLCSPFIAGAQSEMTARALLDAGLRERRDLAVPSETLLRYAQGSAPIFAERLALLQRVHLDGLRGAGDWPVIFRALLLAAGWPGDRALESGEFQALKSWDKLLAEFRSLDRFLPLVDYQEAVATLRRLTNEKLFQPESAEVPVQILGMREALGQKFDHLWMMGLDEEAWPMPCKPNPFIPLTLQRKLGLPHATPERELAYAKAVLHAISSSAENVVLSWPKGDGDVGLACSRLIAKTPLVHEVALQKDFTAYRDVVHRARDLERFDDDHGPVLAECVVPRAGNRLFEYQAACPFRAFAAFRLKARGLEEPAAGSDALERGIIAHKAIAAVWSELKTYDALLAAKNLPEIVFRAVERVVAEEARRRPHTFTPVFTALEKRRLRALMLEWLELDLARAPFKSVECEVKQSKTVEGVTVNLRIDRIDRLRNGSIALTDYKTGNCNKKDWLSERPNAPQLPLYAYGVEAVAAISYGVLSRGEVSYSGYSRDDGIAAGIERAENWDAMSNDWKRVLEELARQFLSGDARVDPKLFPKTCENCEMTAFCRVAERGPLRTSDMNDDR